MDILIIFPTIVHTHIKAWYQHDPQKMLMIFLQNILNNTLFFPPEDVCVLSHHFGNSYLRP